MKPFVVAVTATCGRAPEFARLLDSLKNAGPSLGGVVAVDNGNDAATQRAFEASGLRGLCLPQQENTGCGGGLRIAELAALEHFKEELTHCWILDDDAVPQPGALDVLLHAMERENADAACPMVLNEQGGIGNFPGLLDAGKFRAIREMSDPAKFVSDLGPDAVPFSWSHGIALLVSRRALEDLGPHRAYYWVRGEDLEFSLRITRRRKGVFVPVARVSHIPPAPSGVASQRGEYLKHCAMLQNLCYTSLHLEHGRRIARTIPGNFLRFFKTYPLRQALPDAALACWLGGVRAQPAGAPGAQEFRERLERRG